MRLANKHCHKCGVALEPHASDEQCPVCLAYDEGEMILREGICFYVTAARMRELPGWLAGEWIMSRIVERHATFIQAREAVWVYNQDGQSDEEQGCFFFISSNNALA